MGKKKKKKKKDQENKKFWILLSLSWAVRWAGDSPAGIVYGSPVIVVQLLDWETAVQKLRDQLSVSFQGAAVERKVVHPLVIPVETGIYAEENSD